MMKNKDITILVDMDDTIEDLLGAWCKWLNEVYDTKVNPSDIKDWDISKSFPMLSKKEVFEPLKYSTFWKSVKPKEDAVEYLNKLFELGFEIYLVTSTHYENIEDKYFFIVQRYFPFINWDHMIIAANKSMIKGDFLIDDAVHNLGKGDFQSILMTAPHNKDFPAERHNMIRADNWEQIYNLIVSYAREKTK